MIGAGQSEGPCLVFHGRHEKMAVIIKSELHEHASERKLDKSTLSICNSLCVERKHFNVFRQSSSFCILLPIYQKVIELLKLNLEHLFSEVEVLFLQLH